MTNINEVLEKIKQEKFNGIVQIFVNNGGIVGYHCYIKNKELENYGRYTDKNSNNETQKTS